MNSDLWTTRLATAAAAEKHRFNHQKNHHNLRGSYPLHLQDGRNINYNDNDDDDDFEMAMVDEDFDDIHLLDQHFYQSRPTICPICSVKVARDMLSHISLQHANLFKRRSRLQRVGIPNSQLLGRDLCEAHLQVLLGGSGSLSNNAHASSAPVDPYLSSFVLNIPGSEVDEIKSISSSIEDSSVKNTSSPCYSKSSIDSSLSNEERERRLKQASGRADFVQDLLFCSLLGD